jgi:arylsulfatase A-like enzyme
MKRPDRLCPRAVPVRRPRPAVRAARFARRPCCANLLAVKFLLVATAAAFPLAALQGAPLHRWEFAEPAGTLPAATTNSGTAAISGRPTFGNPTNGTTGAAIGGYATDGNGALQINGVDYGTIVASSVAQLGTNLTGQVWFRWDVSWNYQTAAGSAPRAVYLINRDQNGANRFRWSIIDAVATGSVRVEMDGSGFAAKTSIASADPRGTTNNNIVHLATGFRWTGGQITGVEPYYSVDGTNFTQIPIPAFTNFTVSNLGDLRLHAKGNFTGDTNWFKVDRVLVGSTAAAIGLGPAEPEPTPTPTPQPTPEPTPGPAPEADPEPAEVTSLSLGANGFSRGLRSDAALGPDGQLLAQTSTTLRAGGNSGAPAGGRNAVLVVPLPALPPQSRVTGARLSVSAQRLGTPAFNADVWGLGFGTSAQPLQDYLAAESGSGVKLADNFLTPAGTEGNRFVRATTPAASDAAFAVWLQAFYDSNPGYTGGAFATLRINPDADPGAADRGYTICSADHPAPIERPSLYLVLDGAEPAQRPNIIIMMTDDQRWDATGRMQQVMQALGRARFPWIIGHTPGLDRLADEGIRFDNAFVTFSLCSPSRTALMTGQYPHMSGIMDNQTYFPTDRTTYASLLRDSGYATGYFGKWHHHDQTERPGFDTTGTFINQGNFAGELSARSNDFHVNGTIVNRREWVEDVSTGYLLDFIDAQAATGRPFMAFLGFKTPHSGEPFADSGQGSTTAGSRIPRNAAQNALFNADQQSPALSYNFKPPFRPGANSGTGIIDTRNYMETIVGVDDCVVRVLDRLDELGIAENTLVIFTSDNGYFIGEHGLGDKRAAYEESIRVPLFIRYPAAQARAAINTDTVLNIDLTSTVLDFAGIKPPDTMQGRSLAPLVRGESAPDWRQSFLYTCTRDPWYPDTMPVINALRRADGDKLVLYPFSNAWTELFRTAVDPYETNNLAGNTNFAGLRSSLASELREHMSRFGLLDARIQAAGADTAKLRFRTGGPLKYRLEFSSDLQTWTPALLGTNNSTTNAFLGRGQPWSLPLDTAGDQGFYRLMQVDDGAAAYSKWSGTGNRPDNPRHQPVP